MGGGRSPFYSNSALEVRTSKAMKKKKATKRITKSVRKAVKKHGIATGVITGAATAMALSGSGATRKVSEALGSGVASLLKAGGRRNEIVANLKKKAGEALVRAGRSLDPEPETAASATIGATDGKPTTRRSTTPRTTT
jgi:hypothetical protein